MDSEYIILKNLQRGGDNMFIMAGRCPECGGIMMAVNDIEPYLICMRCGYVIVP